MAGWQDNSAVRLVGSDFRVRPGKRARHNYAGRPGRKAGGDFSTKIAEAGSRKTAMRFMCDHRLKEKSGRWARQQHAKVTELKLESQFRCNGSDGYLAWLDNMVGLYRDINMQFRMFSSYCGIWRMLAAQ